MRTRPSGGRFGERGSRGRRGRRASSRGATSGRARVICCTSTRSASSASPGPATPSPATATAPAPRSASGSATSGCTRSSTTTPGWPTASSTATSAPPTVTGFVERGLAVLRRARHQRRSGCMSDNAWIYTHNRSLARAARPPRHPPPADPAAPPTDQRQGRALPADPQTRMGARPDLPLKRPPRRTRCHTGSATTTSADPTARSAAAHPSAASTTSRGRTPRARPALRARRRAGAHRGRRR